MDVIISANIKTLYMMHIASDNKNINSRKILEDKSQFDIFAKKVKKEVLCDCVDYQPSVFNYYVENTNCHIVYNTMYNTLVRLNHVEYEKLLGKKRCGKNLARNFLYNGLCVPKQLVERKNYELLAKEFNQRLSKHLSLNITTTLKCNARCSYCYENGVKHDDFFIEKLNPLVNFIKKRKSDTPVALNWFGGEPLLNTSVIDFVTEMLLKEQIEYNSYLITNGSLITKKLVDSKFAKWRIRDVQITLDGAEEIYEKRKAYINKSKGMFKRILKKVELLATKNINVHIRLNVDQDNTEDILDVLQILQNRFDDNSNVSYYPAFLTGNGNRLTERDKIDFIKRMFSRISNPEKMNIGNRMYSIPKTRACMISDPNSFSIDVYGNIYSCEHMVGRPKKSIGNLSKLKEAANQERCCVVLRNECVECVFVPKCMGGCKSNFESNDDPCMIEKYMIQAYVEYLCE